MNKPSKLITLVTIVNYTNHLCKSFMCSIQPKTTHGAPGFTTDSRGSPSLPPLHFLAAHKDILLHSYYSQ